MLVENQDDPNYDSETELYWLCSHELVESDGLFKCMLGTPNCVRGGLHVIFGSIQTLPLLTTQRTH